MKPPRLPVARAALCVATLCVTLMPSGAAPGKLQPTGTTVGAVQFDAIITADFPQSACYVQLFARYWVSPEYYQVAVVWAEPNGRGLYFSIYPQTLTIGSDAKAFSLSHDLFPMYVQTFAKPLGDQGAFTNMFGDYPIPNIRFAEQRALATRIYATDLRDLENPKATGDQIRQIPLLDPEGRPKREVVNLKVLANHGRIDFLQFFNKEQQLLKSVSYEYEGDADAGRIRRQGVVLEERPIMVGFADQGVKVRFRDTTYQFKELPAINQPSGRTCTVEYQPVTLGQTVVSLPVRVEVRGGRDKQLLRSVRMMNFRKIDLTAAQAKQAAAQYSGLTQPHRDSREFLGKYWQKGPHELSKADAEAIRKLRLRFEQAPTGRGNTVGEQLRCVNTLMELNRMLGDEKELERTYQLYLTTLSQNKLFDMVLGGGYCAIDMFLLWGRTTEANMLLSRWLNAAAEINDLEPIRRFAARELTKGNFWTTAELMKRFSSRSSTPASARFEFAATRCMALQELQGLLCKRSSLEDNNIAKAQTDWVASLISTNHLQRLLTDSVAEAQRLLGEARELTDVQQELKRRLTAIAEAIQRKESGQ